MSRPRFLEVTPAGVVAGLASPRRDTVACLLHGLLARPAARPWQTAELAQLADGDARDLGRALFDLQRRQLVEVRLDAPEDDASLWPGVQGDLQDMVRAGAHWAALVDGDGLLLAQAGLAAPQEALPAPAEVSLHLGEGALSASYALAAPGLALGRHALLVRLARRLVRLRAPRS